MSAKIIILGGGVAGLSAAHELSERGFEVEVYERGDVPGGKARSVDVRGTGTEGRADLPGEHGFRFFPRFYKHVTDTMKRIPFEGSADGVYGNLTETSRIEMARFDLAPLLMCSRFPRSLGDFQVLLHDLFDDGLGISHADRDFFAERVWQIITSCGARRDSEYEKLGWWKFIGADSRSAAYQNIFGYGLTRSLVAAKADLASTKTVGNILVQLIFDSAEPGVSSDRLLNGPTNEVWIEPWLKYLRSRGVRYEFNAAVTEIRCENKSIQSVIIETPDGPREVTGDYYIAAFPVEVMASVLAASSAMLEADPHLSDIVTLSANVSWMNGAQLYLKSDVPICNGHVIYVDTPWALTSISQHQFWPNFDFAAHGDGQVRGILSVDISEWSQPGILFGKAARDCTREEIQQEVWAQLKRSLNVCGQQVLEDSNFHSWNLDSDIVFGHEQSQELLPVPANSLSAQTMSAKTSNREPLLVNLVNTWSLRPQSYTGIENLFLASDYVQTYTDLATMEGANEAARRAVNCIIDDSGSAEPHCRLWKLHEPDIFAPLRAYDQVRYDKGLPWKLPAGAPTML